jgi:transcription elongation factor GreA
MQPGAIDRHTPILTRAEYERYRRELDELRRVRDRDLPALLRDARGFVANDATEEIAQIRDDHAAVEARIARIDRLLAEATVFEDADPSDGRVVPGRAVTVRYVRTGAVTSYIVGTGGDGAKVSAQSPVGQALMGRRAGDVVSVALPSGRSEEIEIVSVRTRRAAA